MNALSKKDNRNGIGTGSDSSKNPESQSCHYYLDMPDASDWEKYTGVASNRNSAQYYSGLRQCCGAAMLVALSRREKVMWLNGIKRLASRLGRRKPAALGGTPCDPAYDSEFGSALHDAHWQNLLTSPLDARHYVMEDWTYTPPAAPADTAPPQPLRKRRRYEQ
jgi:hypothetical protein